MIQKGVVNNGREQVWADLGAGSGLFSQALSALLPDNSIVYAVDAAYKGKQQIRSVNASINIIPVKKDFTHSLDIGPCDGVLMANSLHFVRDKQSFLQTIRSILKPAGRLILAEYDTDEGNQWVPYPIAFKNLQTLCNAAGMGIAEKIGEEGSMYQAGGIYSALIKDAK